MDLAKTTKHSSDFRVAAGVSRFLLVQSMKASVTLCISSPQVFLKPILRRYLLLHAFYAVLNTLYTHTMTSLASKISSRLPTRFPDSDLLAISNLTIRFSRRQEVRLRISRLLRGRASRHRRGTIQYRQQLHLKNNRPFTSRTKWKNEKLRTHLLLITSVK
jgi:hypothetical protein